MTETASIKILAEGLEKRYRSARGGEQVALTGVDLAVPAGELVCLVGPSGCGKTTLIKLMAGFETPTGGVLTIDGRPVAEPDPDHIMIFQDYGLFPWRTVFGNVLFGLEARGVPSDEAKARAQEALQLVGLCAAAYKHPHEISGGMKQRVAIARALAVEPSLLFMDEPFGALDAFTRMRLQDELLSLWQGKGSTIVFVTHDLDEAIALGQRVVLMAANPGRIQRIIDIDMPYPRERTDGDFAAYRHELFAEFHLLHEG
ncbi:ABC transporter ATP-binding protein [Thiococcus pfennigii]|jgi:NitT/TauT family transport system ATP-binding protein|uniref:ABC transporter ATP-binding protein n=1 Tax=Thiococcus pfennigii TaxID=1057 RepID=UPI0019035666|nr:ABC transporter ATP-binding protein [Thiococcus pfennigii]MBK1699510.1 ABC transporter [Thiococcus pfennigii]MBK1730708.1 ABC transporter [Thiococcus pfennigii]